jgi:hypothetical protein
MQQIERTEPTTPRRPPPPPPPRTDTHPARRPPEDVEYFQPCRACGGTRSVPSDNWARWWDRHRTDWVNGQRTFGPDDHPPREPDRVPCETCKGSGFEYTTNGRVLEAVIREVLRRLGVIDEPPPPPPAQRGKPHPVVDDEYPPAPRPEDDEYPPAPRPEFVAF